MVGRALDAAVGALMFLSSILSVLKKTEKIRNECIVSLASHLTDRCEPRWRSWVESWERDGARALRWRGVWLDLGWITHARIIIPTSVNLLPIQADFVTERDTGIIRTTAASTADRVVQFAHVYERASKMRGGLTNNCMLHPISEKRPCEEFLLRLLGTVIK